MIATAFAVGTPTYKASTHYHSAPTYKEKKPFSQPFADEYKVVDNYSKNNFQKTETQDAEGKVAGSFKIDLPNSRIHTATKQVTLKSPILSNSISKTISVNYQK